MRWTTQLVVPVVTALCAIGGAAPDANAADWRTDIDVIATELPKRHPDPFQVVPKSAFDAALAQVKAELPGRDDAAIAIRLQQAVASLRDAHTELDTRIPPMSFYPLRLFAFDDGIYVTRAGASSAAACGARLLAVNGMPVEEVYQRVSTVVSAENDQWLRAVVPMRMVRSEVLEAVGVTPIGGFTTFSFQSPSGARFDLPLAALEPRDAAPIIDAPFKGDDLPLAMQHPELNYWYTWDPSIGLLYLQYNVCADDPQKSFATVAREMQGIVLTETVRTFVIDLRKNGGGSSEVLQPFIDALPGIPQLQGRVFALIGRGTFSSAMLNAVGLRRAGAILVGEGTGGKPNSFGEVRSLVLPSSGVRLYYSTRFIKADDGFADTLAPDIAVPLTSDDFFAKRDATLDAVMNRPGAASSDTRTGGRRRAAAPQPRRIPHTCF
jgi:hypothetical protein